MRARIFFVLMSFVALGSTTCGGGKKTSSVIPGGAGQGGGGSGGTSGGSDASGGTSSETGGTAGAAGEGPIADFDLFDAWREARSALRKSPDHLPARAAELVRAADVEGLFELVRDSVRTYPSDPTGFENSVSAQRWGAAATLRGGAGTPREKAELLIDLYEQAGLEARIRQGAVDPELVTGEALLLGEDQSPAFAPPMDEDDEQRWREALGHPEPLSRPVIDPDGDRAEALFDQLLDQLPDDAEAPAFDFTLERLPLVQVNVDGQWQYANPNIPGIEFGDAGTVDTPVSTSSAGSLQTVRVALEGAFANAPYERFSLVAGEFGADQIVGRRIELVFAPPAGIDELASISPKDAEVLVPMLYVDGPDLDTETADELARVGDPFTRTGDRYALGDNGELLVNGTALADSETSPELLDRVAEVHATARTSAFPLVRLDVAVLDADGQPLPRLGADAFSVFEEDAGVSFSVRQNEAPPPRVMLLFDQSTSVPEEFRGTQAAALGTEIIEPLYDAYPDALVRVGVPDYGVTYAADSWASSLSQAQSQLDSMPTGTGSQLWEALDDVNDEHPTLIVLFTDGDATDEPDPEYVDGIASGAPILSVGVGDVTVETLARFTELSGGMTFEIDNHADAVDAVLETVGDRAIIDYELSYRAPRSGPATRQVRVELGKQRAETEYDVPEAPASGPVLSGLYLTLEVGGRQSTRALAGFDRGFSTAVPTITQEMIDDVESVLFGRTTIAVEAAAPPPSVVLDDWISEKLDLEPLYDALTAEDTKALTEAVQSGASVSPGKLPLLFAPLYQARTEQSLTYEAGLRAITMVQRAREGGPYSRALDVFPLTLWSTAAEDPRTAWEQTLRATASLAVREAELMQGKSTLDDLMSVPLTLLDRDDLSTQPDLTSEQARQWAAFEEAFPSGQYLFLAPFEPGPFWVIHKETGTLVGVLADGSGGATEDICATYDYANAYLQGASLLGNLLGVSVGGWVELAKWEVKMVTMATLVIGTGAPAGEFSDPASAMACGILNDALGDAMPGYGLYDAVGGTLDTIGVDTGAPMLCGGDGPC